jgi:hypothetical protein
MNSIIAPLSVRKGEPSLDAPIASSYGRPLVLGSSGGMR